MSRFQPSRASPPAKPKNLPGPSHRAPPSISDFSRSSAISVPELQDLSPQDIEFFNAVIARAAPSATTFLTVFKAYNDVLHERGLDPQTEVVYYKKLLKLSSVRAANWGERWRLIKSQYGYDSSFNRSSTPAKDRGKPHTSGTPNLTAPVHDDDIFSLHSHQHEAASTESEQAESEQGTETELDEPQRHSRAPSRLHSRVLPNVIPSRTTTSNGLVSNVNLNLRNPILSNVRSKEAVTPITRPWDETSDMTEDIVPSISTTPPSYGAATRDLIGQRERRGSAINEDDAWNKVKMIRDEQDADRFREEKLLERCWDVWRQGYEWINTTQQQISEARDNLVLRLCLHRWRNSTASRVELLGRVTVIANNRCLRVSVNQWKAKLKERRQAMWRNEMRSKMKTVRESRETLLKKDAWAKWRQSYRSHLSEQHYNERLVLRLFERWSLKLMEKDHLEAASEQFTKISDGRMVGRCFEFWKRQLQMKNNERMVVRRVGLRVMGEAMDVWKKHSHERHSAHIFHDTIIVKKAIRSWKAARDRIHSLEKRAAKHLARQDDVLVRAVTRVWKAHERGRLLERVRAVRLVKDVWIVWKRKMQEQEQRQDFALAFSMRSNSYAMSSSLQTWRRVYTTHQNASTFATQYNSTQLCFRILLKWRLQFRSQLALVKQAKVAEKFFLRRRILGKWKEQLSDKRRERSLTILSTQKLAKCFSSWKQKTQKRRLIRLAEQQIHALVSTRITRTVLSLWTNRVIEIKLRELEVSQRISNVLVMSAFKKWKTVCLRHVEELSLMESYQDVKREENIRRMFNRWLNASRSSRYRRQTLQQKEDDMKRAAIAVSWDKWRGRFKDERLRPIEHNVIVQSRRNLLFRAFGIWHSRTKSLPAIRFHASYTKAKCWNVWRASMPQALQAKKAREMDKKQVLSKTLEKWVQTHRTKIALKAVARARYLRLPTAAPRQGPDQESPASYLRSFLRQEIPLPIHSLQIGVYASLVQRDPFYL
ncbi:hypothetical protein SERLADRAFT_452027 [Serpula lacrymans var. lacrymans S7.9]|uniref:Sfi1 spindle body domain-containing protein n=1 Tax=Serpula lacrymans var. lacrymans (strain S7.9) TaxID=578457 RepID=F8P619_SERL9|nr:uncharacterized protein SERLADRAFT_452027 [Serpula lacrymans var. lacrymans S7.9]EGO20886.1 hypothetical protein SERLADRAFT_452027 [Serpula lacrymans var. lacrymans S7.9]